MAKNSGFNNDWRSLSQKPEVAGKEGKKFDNEKVVEPYRIRREGSFATMYPSENGEKYAFVIVPDAKGKSFVMTEIMTIKRFTFTNPKTNEDYYETLKIPMDPEKLFDMSVLDKASKDPSSLTEDDKKVIKDIKRHKDLVKRYKDLYWSKVEGINFKYSPTPSRYSRRMSKDALTGFFGIKTKWKGEANKEQDYSVKFINTRYIQFQEKFRALLNQMADSHDEIMPNWYEKYFSTSLGINGVVSIDMGPMGVGGRGVTINLVKLGKDEIDDAGVGVTQPIDPKTIKTLEGKDNELSHLHYYMGFKSTESLWQDMYVDRFEEAILDLENHVKEVELENSLNESSEEKAEAAQ